MATVSIDSTKQARAQQAQQANDANPTPAGNGFMNYLDQVSKATDYMLTHPISDIANALSAFAGLVTGNGRATRDATRRMLGWAVTNPVAALKTWTLKQVAALEHQIVRLQDFVIRLNKVTADSLRKYITDGLAVERKRRLRGDQASEKYTRGQVGALHHLIEHEAASAYRGGYQGRITVVQRVADYLANHNPIVRRLAGDLIAGALDLASIDNPLARLALGFIAKRIVERLGVDKVAGRALSDLLAPLLGNPRPHDLPGVIRDVSARLGALEGQQAQFWTDGGAEVEQAGRQWSRITSPLADAAIVVWLGQAITDPQAWARELSDVTLPLLDGAKDVMTELLREG